MTFFLDDLFPSGIDVIDFGDGLTQKLRTMSACSEDAVSVNIGAFGNC